MKSKIHEFQKNNIKVMSKNIFTFVCCFLATLLFAQTNPLDAQLININQSAVTSGFIYDRVTPLANLSVFNIPGATPHNTADFRFFKQALVELYTASNYTKLVSLIDDG